MGKIHIHPKAIEYLRSGRLKRAGVDTQVTSVPTSLLVESLFLLTQMSLGVEDTVLRSQIQVLCKKLDGAFK